MEKEIIQEMHLFEDIHWWFIGRRLILKKVLDHYFSNRKNSKILEVGCGTGGNFQMLQSYGTLSAMELDDEARQMAEHRKICHVKKGKLPEEIPFTDKFDLVCALDVIEHIENDLSALEALRDKLNRNGKILITVPAYQFLWSKHDVLNHHKRRYLKKQLLQLISKAGLGLEYSTHFNTFMCPVVVLFRMLNNILDKRESSDIKLPSRQINRLLTKVFYSERIFLPKITFPFGVSILALAKKL